MVLVGASAQFEVAPAPPGTGIKIIRERLKLSRSEVARRVDVDVPMLFRIENAGDAIPSFAVVVRYRLGARREP